MPQCCSNMFNIRIIPEVRVQLRQRRGRRPEVGFVNDGNSGATIKLMKTDRVGKQLGVYAAKVRNFE